MMEQTELKIKQRQEYFEEEITGISKEISEIFQLLE